MVFRIGGEENGRDQFARILEWCFVPWTHILEWVKRVEQRINPLQWWVKPVPQRFKPLIRERLKPLVRKCVEPFGAEPGKQRPQ